MPAAASRTLAAPLRPLTRAARAVAGLAARRGRWLPPCPRPPGPAPLPQASGRRAARPAPAPARFLTGTAEAGVYGPPGRVGPKYLPGRAPAGCPRAGRAAPGRDRSGPSGTTAANAQAAINRLPRTADQSPSLPIAGFRRTPPDPYRASSAFWNATHGTTTFTSTPTKRMLRQRRQRATALLTTGGPIRAGTRMSTCTGRAAATASKLPWERQRATQTREVPEPRSCRYPRWAGSSVTSGYTAAALLRLLPSPASGVISSRASPG